MWSLLHYCSRECANVEGMGGGGLSPYADAVPFVPVRGLLWLLPLLLGAVIDQEGLHGLVGGPLDGGSGDVEEDAGLGAGPQGP